jgi:hypothetical protein
MVARQEWKTAKEPQERRSQNIAFAFRPIVRDDGRLAEKGTDYCQPETTRL